MRAIVAACWLNIATYGDGTGYPLGVFITAPYFWIASAGSTHNAYAARAAERETAKKAREAELAAQAARAAELAAQVQREAEKTEALAKAEAAERDAALATEQKAERDARYAARKAAKKIRRRGY